jgi:hypothetical protein
MCWGASAFPREQLLWIPPGTPRNTSLSSTCRLQNPSADPLCTDVWEALIAKSMEPKEGTQVRRGGHTWHECKKLHWLKESLRILPSVSRTAIQEYFSLATLLANPARYELFKYHYISWGMSFISFQPPWFLKPPSFLLCHQRYPCFPSQVCSRPREGLTYLAKRQAPDSTHARGKLHDDPTR